MAHGFVLLQCSQTAATICKAHLHSLLSGLPILKYFIFVLTRGPGDTYSFQNFIIENVLHLCKDLWKWSIRENTNSGFIRSGTEVITFWPVALFRIVSLFLETYEQSYEVKMSLTWPFCGSKHLVWKWRYAFYKVDWCQNGPFFYL